MVTIPRHVGGVAVEGIVGDEAGVERDDDRRPIVRPIGIGGKGGFNQTFVGIG